ncbi:thioesterase [Anoxybacillus salavatliensis]|uniref:thioesterase family protein n=1 Tax=Anoxybacillus gonensis TaxID=198467 RepID=UPI00214CB9AA|nr:thioesterase [Anoxybacillus gonensis]MCQ5364849.1 thioesterase [Anoxybacillus gonensis]
MKPGLEIGQKRMIKAKVTPDMYAQFEGNIIHPVYSTVAMVYHMEWAARQIILPYLETHEEGVGVSVVVDHISPTIAGMEVTVTATLTALDGVKVVCDVEVVNDAGMVAGKGAVVQYIVQKETFYKKIEQLEQTKRGDG